jgi:hypothetical protein
MTHDLWESLNETVISYLAGVKLSQLVEKQRAEESIAATSVVRVRSPELGKARRDGTPATTA